MSFLFVLLGNKKQNKKTEVARPRQQCQFKKEISVRLSIHWELADDNWRQCHRIDDTRWRHPNTDFSRRFIFASTERERCTLEKGCVVIVKPR